MKQYSPPRLTTNCGQPFRRRRIGCCGMVNWPLPSFAPVNRVLLGGAPMNVPSLIHCALDELELPGQVRPDEGEHDAAVGAVVLQHALGQRRAVAGAAPDHPVQSRLADDGRVARVHPPGVRAERALEAPRIVRRT